MYEEKAKLHYRPGSFVWQGRTTCTKLHVVARGGAGTNGFALLFPNLRELFCHPLPQPHEHARVLVVRADLKSLAAAAWRGRNDETQ
jgi:hypothetical protein